MRWAQSFLWGAVEGTIRAGAAASHSPFLELPTSCSACPDLVGHVGSSPGICMCREWLTVPWPPSMNGEGVGSLLQSRQFYPIAHQYGKLWFQPEGESNCITLIWNSSLRMLQWPGYKTYRAGNHLNHLPRAAATTWSHPLEWREEKLSRTSNRKDQPPIAQSFSILLFMRCCNRKLILKIIQMEILSWQCFLNSNWWNAAWHSPLTINLAPPSRLWTWNKWDSRDRISFGLITNHRDNGFALTELSGKPVCFWASNPCLDLVILLYWKRVPLPAKSDRGRKGVEKGIKLLLSMKNLQWCLQTLPCSQVTAASTQVLLPLEQPHWKVAHPTCSEVRKEWKWEMFPASKTKLMLVSFGLPGRQGKLHIFIYRQSRGELCAKASLPLLLSLFPGNINIISILDQGKGTTSLQTTHNLVWPSEHGKTSVLSGVSMEPDLWNSGRKLQQNIVLG